MNKKSIFLLIAVLAVSVYGIAQERTTDKELEQALREMTSDFRGTAGVYVYNLETGKEAGVNADTIFPTASIVKVPILAGVFQKIEEGEFSLNEPLVYDAKRAYGGSGIMQFFKDSTKTDLRIATALMITFSDNTSSLWSQELAGGGKEINALMSSIGLEHTRVNSRTQGREKIWEKYGWGQTTPREMANLLVKIRRGDLINPAASEEMYRMLTNSYYTDYNLSQIPPYIQTAAKQGMVNDSRSELVMVNAPHGDYVFYFATKDNEDRSWEYDNEAWELGREISAYLWNYFEPQSDWKPAEGREELVRGMVY
ncbi:MAG TPA: serine hydrolase [Salinimicrobium sp.]|nr:serine hydrolase [Salinimicrobium sp.]